ncbi:MAG: UPF0182 family protein [Dehalococcoidia bacterium]|nr:UPF0182 family protein [Dehalococcoidia bacterium]
MPTPRRALARHTTQRTKSIRKPHLPEASYPSPTAAARRTFPRRPTAPLAAVSAAAPRRLLPHRRHAAWRQRAATRDHFPRYVPRCLDGAGGGRHRSPAAGAVDAFARSLRLERIVGDKNPTYRYQRDVETFFRKLRIWDIAPAPEAEATVQPAPTTTVRGNAGGRNTTLAATDRPIAPLYLTMQLPGERGQEFVLSRPFVPRGKANQLASFMVARSDPEHYGELVVYRIPDDKTAPSPARAASTINTDELIGEQFTLLERRDADVQPGSVQLLPLGDSIVYIRPIYVRTSTEGAYPRLRFAAVAYGDQAVLTNFNPERGDTSSLRTLEEAIEALITGDIPETPVEEPEEPEEPSPPEPQEPLPATVEELLTEAADLLARAEEVQGEDLGEYQRLVEEARRRIDEAARLAAGGSSPAAGDGSGAPPASVEIVPARPEGG